MKLISSSKTEASEVVAHDVAPLLVNTDPGRFARLGWLIVLFGVGGFLLWASFAPLDRGVPMSGTVTVATNRKAIQHQNGGTVQEILVRDGDVVKAGQILVRMNDIQAKSASDISRGQYISARATEARLIAERDGKAAVAFPPALLPYKDDTLVTGNVSAQAQLFMSRQSSLRNELAAADESIGGLRVQIAGLQASRDSKKIQLKITEEQLSGLRDLARDGYIARNRLLDVERTAAQLSGAIAEDNGNLGRAQRQIGELRVRKAMRLQDYQKEVRTQLADVQKEAEALSNRLTAQNYDEDNTVVRSPVAGTVVGATVFMRGAVIGPGFKMMDIVPSGDPLVVDGQMAVNLVDKVHAGLAVELIFSAFNQNKTPHIPGVITQVSADRFTDEHGGQPYYKVQAKVAPKGVPMLADLQVRPGMPVEMFVKTGERTMMSYLLKPIFDRAKTSMTED